jgi:3-hydroxymyristoyl/3-hydroxydecanoyl-(acyl carrier protein) dehydratase
LKSWLSSLPHQIPFRAASSARLIDDKTIEGWFHPSPDDALLAGTSMTLELLLVEAMAQVGGTLAFQASSTPGFLSAIDEARFHEPVVIGEALRLEIVLQASFNRIHRLEGRAMRGEVEVARARFYLATAETEEPQNA